MSAPDRSAATGAGTDQAGLEARRTPVLPARSARRPAWHPATVRSVSDETPNARRLVLDVPTWPGNDPGQHLDLRLTAEDGYTATRSYSIASSSLGPPDGSADGSADRSGRVVLAVDRVEDGEVSSFLVDAIEPGDALDVNGPLGGWFVWHPTAMGAEPRPVQLIAGGSGVVPIVAMTDAHAAAADPAPFRLLYAVRGPSDVFFRDELDAAVAAGGVTVDMVYSRRTPAGWPVPAGRLTREVLAASVFPPDRGAAVYVCGSTPFVEQVIRWLGELGHDTAAVRAERFGGS